MANNYNMLRVSLFTRMRTGVFLTHLILILCLGFTLAYSALAGKESIALPPLKTDEQKLAFLIAIKKQVPKLFSDAARYDIDLFTLLNDEAALVAKLTEYPEYATAFDAKKYYDIIIAPPQEGLLVQSSSIDPKALEAWRNKALAILDEFGEKLLEDIQAQAAVLTGLGIKENDNIGAILTDFNKSLIQKAKIKKPSKSKDIDPAIALYNKITRGADLSLKDRLRGVIKSYEEFTKLTDLPEKGLFERALRATEADEKLTMLTELYLLLHRIEGQAPDTKNKAQESLRALSAGDLIFFSDKDALEPALAKQFSKFIHEQLIKRLVSKISKNIKYYADQRTGETTKITSKVHLRQVVPAVGIFRGCTGGDCSSQYSFPYPNDPNESVFFILDELNNTKGYVSATRILADGVPALYVITISGNRVSAGDTELILRGLDKIKEQLGVKHIVLPVESSVARLINFPGPRAIYEKYTKGRKPVAISYLLPQLRSAIETYPSRYNIGKYDYMSENQLGVLFQPKDQLAKGLDIKLVELTLPALKPQEVADIPNQDIFEFLVDLHRSNRIRELSKIEGMEAVQKKIPSQIFKSIIKLADTCKISQNQDPLPVLAFQDLLQILLQGLDIKAELLKSHSDLFWPGIMGCSDAFSADHIESVAGMIIKNHIKVNENNTLEDLGLGSYAKLAVLVKNTSKYKEFIAALLENIRAQEVRTKVAAIKKLVKLEPKDYPRLPLALAQALKDSDKEVRYTAAEALGQIKSSQLGNFALAEALKDIDPDVRSQAIEILKQIGPGERLFIDEATNLALIAALQEGQDQHVRSSAAWLLGYINRKGPATRVALIKAMKNDHDPEVRLAAARALGHIKPTYPSIHMALAEAMKADQDPTVRIVAADTLGFTKPTDPGFHRDLVEAMNEDPEKSVRWEAVNALLTIKPTDPAILQALVEAMNKHQDTKVRAQIIRIIMLVNPKDPGFQRALAQALKDPHNYIRKEAAKLLGKIKPTDPAILSALTEASKDPEPEVRQAAARALEQIQR